MLRLQNILKKMNRLKLSRILERLLPGRRRANSSNHHSDQHNSGDGRKPEGPPDLDQVWKDFQNQLQSIFGKKKSNGGSNNPKGGGGSVKISRKLVLLVIAVLIVIWLLSGLYIIREGNVGVLTRFGSYQKTITAGVQWRFPYPIESVRQVNVSNLRSFSVGYRGDAQSKIPKEALMLTEDENIVDVQFDVQWRIKAEIAEDADTHMSPAANYIYATVNPDESVKQAAQTAMREIVGTKSMNNILYEGRAQAARDTRDIMQRILDRYKTGIDVIAVAIQNVQPPDKVQDAFEDVNRAKQDQERMINEGRAYANDVLPIARGQAARMELDAEGYKARVIGNSIGDTKRFESVEKVYSQAPEITRQRMYIDAMRQVFTEVPAVIVDRGVTNNSMTLLPLDKLMQSASSQSPAPAPAKRTETAADDEPLPSVFDTSDSRSSRQIPSTASDSDSYDGLSESGRTYSGSR